VQVTFVDCTQSTVSFQHALSAISFMIIVALSIASSWHCCALVSQWPFALNYNSSNHWGRFCLLSLALSASFYWVMILGPSHFSCQALRGTRTSWASQPKAATCISIHTTWWLLEMPFPNARYPNQIAGNKSVGMKIPLIGVCPRLCVFSYCWPCCVVMAS